MGTKNNLQVVGDEPKGAAAVAKADDWRKLARPVVRQAETLFSAGHNVVVDLNEPDALILRIDTSADAIAETEQASASKEKLKENPAAKGARYLARIKGGMYGSAAIVIAGKRYWLKCTLEEEKSA